MSNTSWKHGYYADAGYTYGHYPETLPNRLRWAALLRGHVLPEQNFRYLDLGCGQGLSLLMAASLHPESEFVGVDFLPEHVAHGRRLAALAGLRNVRFIEADFISLAESPEALGEFDYAVAHGIATWVAPSVKAGLIKLAAAVLKPGGVFYSGYNTYPGWLTATPFQHLVLLQQRHNTGAAAIQSAQGLMKELAENSPHLFTALPGLQGRLDSMKGKDPAYLVQEYNNHHWQPVFVSEMMDAMREVKLDFLGTATLPDAFTSAYPQKLREWLAQQDDVIVREQLLDYAINQSFRRDLYVKGTNRAWRREQFELLGETRVLLNPLVKRPEKDQPYRFIGGSNELLGAHAHYSAVLDQLAGQTQAVTITQLKALLPALKQSMLWQEVSYLAQGGWLLLASPAAIAEAAQKPVQALNKVLAAQVRLGAPYRHLVVPAGGSMAMRDTDLLMMALEQTGTQRESMSDHLVTEMLALRLGMQDDAGKAVSEPQAMKALLQPSVENYYASKVHYKQLKAVP